MQKIKCNLCENKFNSEEAMTQHKKDKHVNNPFNIKENKTKKINKKYFWWAIGVIFLLFILYLIFRPGPSYNPLTQDTDHIKGNQSATVTIIEYSDFQCPFCGKFWRDTLPSINEDYINTGKVKMIYRHHIIPGHKFAEKAAEASECAADQGKFLEYHDKLFGNQNALTIKDLKNYAIELNLDVKYFNDCLDSSVMSSRVKADSLIAKADKVGGTPFFKINNEIIEGAYPFETFKEAIDKELEV